MNSPPSEQLSAGPPRVSLLRSRPDILVLSPSVVCGSYRLLPCWLVFVIISGRWQSLPSHDIWLLLASGIIGIFIGDSLLFSSLNRLGPRRAGILFALNAPMAAVFGWLLLGESLSWFAVAGIAVCVGGVMLAIFFGKRSGQNSHARTSERDLVGGCGAGAWCRIGASHRVYYCKATDGVRY